MSEADLLWAERRNPSLRGLCPLNTPPWQFVKEERAVDVHDRRRPWCLVELDLAHGRGSGYAGKALADFGCIILGKPDRAFHPLHVLKGKLSEKWPPP